MGQILMEAVLRHMEDKEVIQGSQHGFTEDKLCLPSLMALYDGVITVADKVRLTDVIYLSLCYATDMVPHGIIKRGGQQGQGGDSAVVRSHLQCCIQF